MLISPLKHSAQPVAILQIVKTVLKYQFNLTTQMINKKVPIDLRPGKNGITFFKD